MRLSEQTSNVKSTPNGKRVRWNISHPQLSITNFNDEARWCAWREEIYVNKDGSKNPTKVPYCRYRSDRDRKRASSKDPNTWITRDEAKQCWRRMQRNDPDAIGGVGLFQGQIDNGYWLMGLDLDRCVDQETGVVASWAEEIIKRFDSYAEVSPSGTGVKVFFLVADEDKQAVDELLDEGRPATAGHRYRKTFAAGGHREIAFDTQRYYAVTGEAISDASIQGGQDHGRALVLQGRGTRIPATA
jgi:putative DNA primase/helicase